MRYEVDEQKRRDGAHEILKNAINKLEKLTGLKIEEFARENPHGYISSVQSYIDFLNKEFSEVYMDKQETVRDIIDVSDYFREANQICLEKLNEYMKKILK